MSRILLGGSVLLLIAACNGDDSMDSDGGSALCEPGEMPSVFLGRGVGSAFVQLEDGQEVGLDVAPQGGFGVSVIIRTERLRAGAGELASALLETEMAGTTTGSFLLEEAALACRSDGTGGTIFGVVVGFDPDVYRTNDDLLALDGQAIDLVVTVTDAAGTSATARQPVTLRVGI